MKKQIYFILGYGVPKDMLSDKHYDRYFSQAFNCIYNQSAGAPAVIIFSGGSTDCYKPYKRTEGAEMLKLFKKFCNQSFVRKSVKQWKLLIENKSLSTLENLLFAKNILIGRNINRGNLTIFCEATRDRRIKILAGKIFSKLFKIKIVPVNFDTSINRYCSKDFLDKKEKKSLKLELRVLKDKRLLKKARGLCLERLEMFRKEGYDKNPAVVKKWWEEVFMKL
jgi:hypothetical protein